jgi:nickel/cobalt transporter (NicO) family protein
VKRTVALVILVAALVLGVGPVARAHPLGNFTVNRYAEIVVAREGVTVRYVLDLAEIPSFQELQRVDPDGDGPMEDELQRWADRTATEIAPHVVLQIGGRRSPLHVGSATATLTPGQGGLSLLRLEVTMSAGLRSRAGLLTLEDRNDPGRLGWREITARGTDGVTLVGPTVPAVSVTDGLRSYPDDLLSSPLAVTEMRARFQLGTSGATGSKPATLADGSRRPVADGGSFARLLDRRGVLLMLLAVLAALALGAWHALLPGHGKTLMAAAMVGSGAGTRQAVTAGMSVAAMHTVSVIGLGLLILLLEQAFRPEAVYPWLRLASGVVAVGIGMHLVRRRWRSWRRRSEVSPTAHDHGADHDHHPHPHEVPPEGLLSRRGIAALAFAGGVLPSPSALIVLLASIQRGRAAYGLGLVLAFSVGLAVSLVLVGLGLMRAGRIADRPRWATLGVVVPLGSAAAIVAIGVVGAGGGIASL